MKRALLILLLFATSCRSRAPEPDPAVLISTGGERAILPEKTPGMPRPLRFGLVPVFRPEDMAAAYGPLAAYLGEQLGTVVELKISPSYEESIALVAEDGVDLVQLSPLAYVKAKERTPSLQLLATNISEGSSSYSGYLLTRAKDNIRSLDELRGKRIGFVDEASASGYLLAYGFLLDHGIDPSTFFSERLMTRRHDLVISELIEGKHDVAATFSGALLNAEANGLDIYQVEIVAKTGRIPYDAWCVSGKLTPVVRARIRDVLLSLSTRTKEGRDRLAPLKSINAFTQAEDSAYDEIRRVKRVVEEATQ